MLSISAGSDDDITPAPVAKTTILERVKQHYREHKDKHGVYPSHVQLTADQTTRLIEETGGLKFLLNDYVDGDMDANEIHSLKVIVTN